MTALATEAGTLWVDDDRVNCHCGAVLFEDLTIAHDAMLYVGSGRIRQWRCLNGHAITCNPYLDRQVPKPLMNRCDVCGGAITDRRFKRHPACRGTVHTNGHAPASR